MSYSPALPPDTVPQTAGGVGVAGAATEADKTSVAGRSRLAAFLFAGAVAYGVNEALLLLIVRSHLLAGLRPLSFNMGLLLASLAAMGASIVVRFLINDALTFRDRRDNPFATRLRRSCFTSLASPLLALAAVNLLPALFGLNYLVANSAGIAVGLAWNWTCSTTLVWPAGASVATSS